MSRAAEPGAPLRATVVVMDETVRLAVVRVLEAAQITVVASCGTAAEIDSGDPVEFAFLDESAAAALLRSDNGVPARTSTIVASSLVPPHRLAQLLRRFDVFVAGGSPGVRAQRALRVAAGRYVPVAGSAGCRG